MKKLLFILSIWVFLGIDTIAQKGQTSEVKSSYHFTAEWSTKDVSCKYIKVNNIENDTLSFISIQFKASKGEYGYVYLNNQDELNSFIQDLENTTLQINKDSFLSVNQPNYQIKVEDVSILKNKIENRIVIYEKDNEKSFVILNVDEVNKLLSWLININF
jgi:hypothetical protein